MAEKQLAYRAGGKDEFFADDDPLAELARIVGYDKRPSTPVAANQRQEPAFDLEDELLREFERYDAPRSPQASQPNPAVYSEPVYGNGTPANDFAAVEPTHAPEPQSEVQAAYDAPAAEHVRQPEEPVHAEPPVVDASHFEPAEESWEAVVEPTTMPVAAEELEELASAPEVANRDLVDELEMSISAPDVQPTAPRTQQWVAATIRLPLANFNAPRREPTMDAFGAVEPVPTIEPVAPAAPPEVATVVPEPVAEFVAHKQPSYPVEMDRAEAVQAETPVVSDPDPVVGMCMWKKKRRLLASISHPQPAPKRLRPLPSCRNLRLYRLRAATRVSISTISWPTYRVIPCRRANRSPRASIHHSSIRQHRARR